MCFNKKVIAGLVAAGVAVFLVAPAAFSAALPLLILAACPLSMMLMMKSMKGMGSAAGDQSRTGPAGDRDTKMTAAGDRTQEARGSIAIQAEIDQLKAEKAALEAQVSHDGVVQ